MKLGWALFTSIALAMGTAAVGSAFADEKEPAGEHEVALDKIPKPAREAIMKEAGTDKVTKVEQKTHNGATVFSAHLTNAQGAARHVEVDAAGKLIKKGADEKKD